MFVCFYITLCVFVFKARSGAEKTGAEAPDYRHQYTISPDPGYFELLRPRIHKLRFSVIPSSHLTGDFHSSTDQEVRPLTNTGAKDTTTRLPPPSKFTAFQRISNHPRRKISRPTKSQTPFTDPKRRMRVESSSGEF